ncbi:alcohol dehydrogenase 2 [Trichomonascus vanleenenianus]|uniref:quinone oxidoreductase family protein n=1 Tax=Trichomonascus vanleenenianus TaxID=2268995 RepID=UPI003EC962B8
MLRNVLKKFPERAIGIRMSSTIPATHPVIRIHENEGPVRPARYENVPVPEIGESEILIRNEYSGVNFIESYFRKGLYKCQFPYTLGREGSGKVVKVGSNVKNYKVGDAVGFLKPGSLATYVAIDEHGMVTKLPEGMSTRDAGASLLQGLTAYVLTTRVYNVKKGDFVLVHAAAGGTGSIIVQLCKRVGATVIGLTSSESKAKIVKENGADYVINYRTEDVPAKVKEITNGKGVNVAYDSVGKDTWDMSMECLAKFGYMVSFGNASGPVPPISVLSLTPKAITLLRPTAFSYLEPEERWQSASKEFIDIIAKGEVKINISKEYPLEQFQTALEDLESGKTIGKLAIKL